MQDDAQGKRYQIGVKLAVSAWAAAVALAALHLLTHRPTSSAAARQHAASKPRRPAVTTQIQRPMVTELHTLYRGNKMAPGDTVQLCRCGLHWSFGCGSGSAGVLWRLHISPRIAFSCQMGFKCPC